MTGQNETRSELESMLEAVARRLGIPYELVSGDFSTMNFSRYCEFQQAMRRGSRFVIDPRREPPEVLQP
jgi:hypothetical protein